MKNNISKHYIPFLLFLLFCNFFTACDTEIIEEYEDTYKRTVIVYIGRDNDLSRAGEDKITSMLEGWNGRNGNLIIYQDTTRGNSGLMEVYRENGKNKIKTIREYENDNSASPEVLRRVIRDAKELYPADSYGLIVFSHATGWLPQNTFTSPRSIMADQGSVMELTDFKAAISDVHFDYIVFEVCLMAGIEVAYELRNNTDYILASSAEIVSPGFRSIYATSMNYLFEEKANIKAFAQDVFNHVNEKQGLYRSGTFSIIKTSGLSALADFIKQQDNNLNTDVNIYDIQYYENKRLFFDFEDYFSRLSDNEEHRQRLSEVISESVIYKDATPQFFDIPITRHSGLTTYILQDKFPYLNEEYKKLAWYKAVFE